MPTRPKILVVRITARDRQTLDAFLYEHRADVLDAVPTRHEDGSVSVEARIPESWLKRMKKPGIAVAVVDKDREATLRARRKKPAPGDPFGDEAVPRGFGRKVKEGGHGRLS